MPKGKGKRNIPPPPIKKKVASKPKNPPPATPAAAATLGATAAPAAASKKTAEKDSLIASRLSTPPRQSDDDKETESESENVVTNKNKSSKLAAKETPPTRRSPRVTMKKKLPGVTTHLESSKKIAATTKESSETVLFMQREHSMFMNCVPATRKDLGADVVAKVRSVVRNTLFKSAKFYPIPSNADKVVGICLYDCDFRLPGVKGDLYRTKHWDAVRSEIIFQTSILRQQVIPKWHVVSRGKVVFVINVCFKPN